MAASEKYVSRFTSIEGNEYVIWVTTDRPIVDEPYTIDEATPTREYTLKEYGFELQYQAGEFWETMRTSSLRFSWEIQTLNQLNDFTTIVTNTDQNWYVTLLKNDTLDWWGYLKLENFIQPNAFPTSVTLEAVDQLTFLNEFDFLQSYYVGGATFESGTSNIIYGSTGDDNAFRFGRKRNGTSVDSPINSASSRAEVGMATLTEFFWSLLYDIEPGLLNPIGNNDGPGGLSVMIKYEHNSRKGDNGIFDELATQLYPYIWDDFRNTDAVSLNAGGIGSRYKVGEMLDNVLKLWNCRIFLSNGRYWIVQYRTYADTPFTASNYSTNPNPVSVGTSPIIDSISTSTLPQISNNTVQVDSGSTHYIKAISEFQYLNRLQSFEVTHYNASGENITRAYINTLYSSNLASSELEQDDEQVDYNPVQNPMLDNDAGSTVHEADYYLYDGTGTWNPVSMIQETSTAAFNTFPQLMAFGRVQARNAVNIKIKGTIISPELSYFQPIVYATQRYVAQDFIRYGNADEVSGTWIRMNLSNTDIVLEDKEVNDDGS